MEKAPTRPLLRNFQPSCEPSCLAVLVLLTATPTCQGVCARDTRCKFRHVNAMEYDLEMNAYQQTQHPGQVSCDWSAGHNTHL